MSLKPERKLTPVRETTMTPGYMMKFPLHFPFYFPPERILTPVR